MPGLTGGLIKCVEAGQDYDPHRLHCPLTVAGMPKKRQRQGRDHKRTQVQHDPVREVREMGAQVKDAELLRWVGMNSLQDLDRTTVASGQRRAVEPKIQIEDEQSGGKGAKGDAGKPKRMKPQSHEDRQR